MEIKRNFNKIKESMILVYGRTYSTPIIDKLYEKCENFLQDL